MKTKAGRGWSAVAALLLAAAGAQAGGGIQGTIHTTGGETLTGSIRWDRNEIFWDDLLDATRREAIPKDPDKREFNMSIFGLRLGGERKEFTTHPLSIPFGHLRSLTPLSEHEARLILKGGAELVVESRSTDIGSGMRELIVDDRERGAVQLGWGSIERVDFAADADAAAGPGRDAERLYGKVATDHGTLEGFIVFDRDASLAGDILTLRRDGPGQVRLGDVARLEPSGRAKARITLAPGPQGAEQPAIDSRVIYSSVSVAVPGTGTVDIGWEDARGIDLSRAPASPAYEAFDGGRRLSGTVHTLAGKALTGAIVWDRDEQYTFDVLDGKVGNLEYGVPFANVRRIRRLPSGNSELTLTGGGSLTLGGTNDVNDGNRGILVRGPDGTDRELQWAEIDRVDFDPVSPPPQAPATPPGSAAKASGPAPA